MSRWPNSHLPMCIVFLALYTGGGAGTKKTLSGEDQPSGCACRRRTTTRRHARVWYATAWLSSSAGSGHSSNAGRYLIAGEALLRACAAAGRACRTGDLRCGGHPSSPRAPHSGTGPPTHAVRRNLEAATAQADRCRRASGPIAHARRRFVSPHSRSDHRLPSQPPRAAGPNCPQKGPLEAILAVVSFPAKYVASHLPASRRRKPTLLRWVRVP